MEKSVVRRLTHAVPLAVALPGAVVAMLSLGLLATAISGAHPLWREDAVNMSEAAALRDRATVVRLIRGGDDPRIRRLVRAGVLFDRAVSLTPLEAAIAAKRAEVVNVILSAMVVDAATWREAKCLLLGIDEDDVYGVVDAHRPPEIRGEPDCAGFVRPW